MGRWLNIFIFLSTAVATTTCGAQFFPKKSLEDRVMIKVNFDNGAPSPLLKKFGLFNSGLLKMDVYERDQHLFDHIVADSLRIDLYFGDRTTILNNTVSGTAAVLKYDFKNADALIELLYRHKILPYWSWCYIPEPLQRNSNWRDGPSDMNAWKDMFRDFAAHYKEKGIRIPYNEIYNEPDNRDFYIGSWDEYIQMYIFAVKGLHESNPDMVVGGPSFAWALGDDQKSVAFLEEVKKNSMPLDFYSYHSYGFENKPYVARTISARKALEKDPYFDTTELHFNEYNPSLWPFNAHNATEHTLGAVRLLTSFESILDETDVTLAHWAQYMDNTAEQLGMVGLDGRTKAGYFAFWAYSRMAPGRSPVEGLPAGVRGMASSSGERAGILLWNESGEQKQISVTLKALPRESMAVRVYYMDDIVDPYWNGGDTVIKAETESTVKGTTYTWNGKIEAPGILYIELGKGGALAMHEAPFKIVRKHYYFPERGKSNHCFYDERLGAFYLGMGRETSARSVVGITVDKVPDMLYVHTKFRGKYLSVDMNSGYTIRVDYYVRGKAEKSSVYTFMPLNPRRYAPLPWGTKRVPDTVHEAPGLLTGRELLNLRGDAPSEWDGRVTLTADMHSTGPDSEAEIYFTEP
jgi:hypothetical protein